MPMPRLCQWTWTVGLCEVCRPPITNSSLSAVAYGNGMFVAVGDAGTVVTSPDGVTWTPQNSVSNAWLLGIDVSYGNGTFVAVGNSCSTEDPVCDGVIVMSIDGTNWTAQ